MSLEYEILISDKVKRMTLAEAYEYIEAVQSFGGDWPLYLTPRDLLEGEAAYEVESITPMPTTHGAVCFIEVYIDEEATVNQLAERLGFKDHQHVRRALESGTPLHRALPPEFLEKLELRSVIRGFGAEVAVPLEDAVADVGERPAWLREQALIETSLFLVDPEKVKAELDKSMYVGEYLRRLERLFAGSREEVGHLLLLRGEFDAGLSFRDLEEVVGELVERLPARRGALMYSRVVPLA